MEKCVGKENPLHKKYLGKSGFFSHYFPPLNHINPSNGITTAGIATAFLTLLATSRGNLRLALTLVALAEILDGLDGFIARKMGCASKFGAELDSFSDSLNFCVVPAFIAYHMGFSSAFSVAVLIVFTASGIWRITNYNLIGSVMENGSISYVGFVTPYITCWFIVVSPFLLRASAIQQQIVLVPFFIFATMLMLSKIRQQKYGWISVIPFGLLPFSILLLWFGPFTH